MTHFFISRSPDWFPLFDLPIMNPIVRDTANFITVVYQTFGVFLITKNTHKNLPLRVQ